MAFEITKDDIHELVTNSPDMVRKLSKVVAARIEERKNARDRASAAEQEAATTSLAEKLFDRIVGFFGTSSRSSASTH